MSIEDQCPYGIDVVSITHAPTQHSCTKTNKHGFIVGFAQNQQCRFPRRMRLNGRVLFPEKEIELFTTIASFLHNGDTDSSVADIYLYVNEFWIFAVFPTTPIQSRC